MWKRWSFVVFALLLALALGACGSAPPSTTDANQQQQQVVQSPFRNLEVSTQIPQTMRVADSYVVRITLRPRDGYVALSDIPAENAVTSETQPTPVGTPTASLLDAFGPGYEPFATARLGAGSFTQQQVSQETQSLRQASVTWEWNVTPLSSGTQLIDAAISLEWTPTSAHTPALPQNPTFTIATVDNAVTVIAPATPTPAATPGVVSIGPLPIDKTGLVTTVLGALIFALIAWLMGRARVRARALQRTAAKPRPPQGS